MTTQYTKDEIRQLKNNSEYILQNVDRAGEEPSHIVRKYVSVVVSTLAVCVLSMANIPMFISFYAIITLVGSLLMSTTWSALMNVYAIHTNEKIHETNPKTLLFLYNSMIRSYKMIGVVLASTIVECYFIITYVESFWLAVFWFVVCSIVPITAIKMRDVYKKVIRVHEYAIENS